MHGSTPARDARRLKDEGNIIDGRTFRGSGPGGFAGTPDVAADPQATKPYYQFDMNETDVRDIVAAVREGKLRSDFMTVAIHAHHFHDASGGERGVGVPETQDLDTNPSLANYLPIFAKAVIDAGADAFLGTGVHVLRGIEIYKGRPED